MYWTWIENYVADDYVAAVKAGSGRWKRTSGRSKKKQSRGVDDC